MGVTGERASNALRISTEQTLNSLDEVEPIVSAIAGSVDLK